MLQIISFLIGNIRLSLMLHNGIKGQLARPIVLRKQRQGEKNEIAQLVAALAFSARKQAAEAAKKIIAEMQ